MNIFVINSGSSSIKYQLFRMPDEHPICSGLVERIGLDNSIITHKIYQNKEQNVIRETLQLKDHEQGLHEVTRLLTDPQIGVIKDPEEINAVGHRVVHGGEAFASTTIINDDVEQKILDLFSLAPLHNPANYKGIKVAEKIFTKAKQVAVFDTAFHQSMPERAYRFAIPKAYYTEHKIRAYGFHGTSHKYVSREAGKLLENPSAKMITIHLGNGCSMTAVENGKSVDHSMGFGPLGGLIMGTRSGDIDPSIIFHLIEHMGMSAQEVSSLLNKQSGMLGLTGHSDMRDITALIRKGDHDAELAYELYAYRIKKYIGSFSAVLNGLDAIVFTAGVGENDAEIRMRVCHEMEYLGISIDEAYNAERAAGIRDISATNSRVRVLVVPTNEELEIAKECFDLLG